MEGNVTLSHTDTHAHTHTHTHTHLLGHHKERQSRAKRQLTQAGWSLT